MRHLIKGAAERSSKESGSYGRRQIAALLLLVFLGGLPLALRLILNIT
jgi:hypothetical protein